MSQFKEVFSATTKVILALFIWSVLIGTCESAAQEGVADVVKRSSDAVVLIVISNSAGQETALGSGFLISADGEVVTNFHVIKEAHSAVVKLSNGAFFPVNGVLASDADKDLAIIKVSGRNLPFLTLGDIDNLHVGDHVVAIGSPLGLEGTVSDGIVSALRDVAKMRWIQTTAPVSHGNSGGPLLDMNDHVVGVITWGVNLESGQNLNFAAPCSEVKALLANANQQAKSLESVASESDRLFTEDKVWTSLTSGNDYKIRQDGDYLYVDWVNAPSGGFLRSELKKSSDGKWRGKTRARLPCRNRNMNFHLGPSSVPLQNITNLCSLEFDDVEIDLLSDRRIEGIAIHSESLDCKKCEPKGVEHRPFTWIPK